MGRGGRLSPLLPWSGRSLNSTSPDKFRRPWSFKWALGKEEAMLVMFVLAALERQFRKRISRIFVRAPRSMRFPRIGRPRYEVASATRRRRGISFGVSGVDILRLTRAIARRRLGCNSAMWNC